MTSMRGGNKTHIVCNRYRWNKTQQADRQIARRTIHPPAMQANLEIPMPPFDQSLANPLSSPCNPQDRKAAFEANLSRPMHHAWKHSCEAKAAHQSKQALEPGIRRDKKASRRLENALYGILTL